MTMHWLLITFLLSLVSAQTSTDPQNATASSILYGYPLLAWQKAFVPVIDAVGANEWSHGRQLSDASDRAVVKPNVDTLYSRLIYDVSQSSVEITIPDIPDNEFKLFSFYDPYGDNFVNIGTGGFYMPGKYLIRPYDAPGGNGTVGFQKSDNTSGGYIGTVSSPTLYGILLVRWGVNASDISKVHGWQNECGVTIISPTPDLAGATFPSLNSLINVYNVRDSPAMNVMSLLAKYAPTNGPSDEFKAAGISNGTYTAVSSVDLAVANATAVKEVAAAAASPGNIELENNGWSVLSPKYAGVYGTNYALRTLIANTGYLALATPYAVYPTWSNSSYGSANAFLNVASNEAILFTFSGKPPLQDTGFWSLTAYGSDYYLIPNKQNVYALGDRSNITYATGTKVYDVVSGDSNGSYQILLQPGDVAPPANWTSNWLPAPSGGGDVVAQLRFYLAEPSLLDGTYKYPVVEKIAAITKGGGSRGVSNDGSSVGTGAGTSMRDAASSTLWVVAMVAVACVISGTLVL